MGASVKIMLSYDYCHFEVAKHTDEDLTDLQINEMRKDCQRLADEAVRQYKVAKDMAAKRIDGERRIRNFSAECERIAKLDEGDRTINEIAMLKQYQDEEWQKQFDYGYGYDYEDDEHTYNF